MNVRTQQLDEADQNAGRLAGKPQSPVYRLQHQLKLIGADLADVAADPTAEFTELADQIEPPIDDSGLKLSPFEKEEMDKACRRQDAQTAVGVVETLASILHAIPDPRRSRGPRSESAPRSSGADPISAT